MEWGVGRKILVKVLHSRKVKNWDLKVNDFDFFYNMQEPPDMKTINEQREMIMRFADRDKDDRIRKEELGLFFSESRRVQETKMDAKGREASKDS